MSTKQHAPNWGGKRTGAGRPRRKPNMTVELTEQATKQLAYFIENLNLNPVKTQGIVSDILISTLSDDYDKWADLFGNQLWQNE